MTRMKFTVHLGVIGLVVAVIFVSARVGAREEVITKDSPQGQDIQRAIDFLREIGADEEAGTIEEALGNGHFIASDELDEDTNAEIDGDDVLYDHEIVGTFDRPPLSRSEDIRLVEIARTLFDENIHLNIQAGEVIVAGNLPGDDIHEIHAWQSTIKMLQQAYGHHWLKYNEMTAAGASTELRCEQINRTIAVHDVLNDALQTYADNDLYGCEPDGRWVYNLLLVENPKNS